ncbi:PA2169 family four-helix-bundle protein [Cellvibrio sp. pealriver]|uniref:PA2169 family four-helix-bundle protein n=1 Tax=Cellvibrio sp. pealriver TaxID=1622269 RepID=UPI00066FE21B|nr:PA2169 family four-helix-bundle protein [Cellvibrio sp. pealriver]
MANNEITAIRDLIKVLNDGVNFYTDAKIELKGSGYESVFQEMIDVRQNALVRLQPLLYAREGDVEEGNTIEGSLRKTYADLLAKIKSSKSKTYIVQLEELEDRTLETIKKAQQEVVSIDFNIALNYILVSMQECHNRMRALKRNVA